MKFNYEMARQHLDAKFNKIASFTIFARPQKGWIRALRDALGMTQAQLAKKMNVSSARIYALEQDEVLGNIKLSTLERAADALNCELVYTFVPRQGLEKMAYNQAEKKAKAMLKNAEHSMELENQPSSKEDDKKQLEMLIQELLKGSQSKLWDED